MYFIRNNTFFVHVLNFIYKIILVKVKTKLLCVKEYLISIIILTHLQEGTEFFMISLTMHWK